MRSYINFRCCFVSVITKCDEPDFSFKLEKLFVFVNRWRPSISLIFEFFKIYSTYFNNGFYELCLCDAGKVEILFPEFSKEPVFRWRSKGEDSKTFIKTCKVARFRSNLTLVSSALSLSRKLFKRYNDRKLMKQLGNNPQSERSSLHNCL